MIEFTGERFVPTEHGVIRQEHLHRYAWCLSMVQGKDVLDVASGEGYGSAMLASRARSVRGYLSGGGGSCSFAVRSAVQPDLHAGFSCCHSLARRLC